MSTFVNIYVLSFNFFQHLYIFEFQVFSGCFPHYIMKMLGFVRLLSFFYICPVFFFIAGKISFFIVGKYSKFFLLRSRFVPFFMDSKNSKYSPLPHRFKWIFHGFLLASSWVNFVFLGLRSCFVLTVRSQLIFAFSLCSLSVRSSVRLLFVEKIKVKIIKREVNIKVNFKVIKRKIKVIKIEIYRHFLDS